MRNQFITSLTRKTPPPYSDTARMTYYDPSYLFLLSFSHSGTPFFPFIPSSGCHSAHSIVAVGHGVLGTLPHSGVAQPATAETPLRPTDLLEQHVVKAVSDNIWIRVWTASSFHALASDGIPAVVVWLTLLTKDTDKVIKFLFQYLVSTSTLM